MRKEHGEKMWPALLDAAQLEGIYTSLGNYPDDDFTKLVGAASAALQLSPNEIVRWLGVQAMPLFANKYPKFFQPHTTTLSFVLTVNSIVHPEVRKLYPGAYVPEFDFEVPAPNQLTMRYRSMRRLCALAEGFVEGAATHFGETVAMKHPECMHRGDAHCLLEFSFSKLEIPPHV